MLTITVYLPIDFAHYHYAPLDDSYMDKEFMDWMKDNLSGAWNWGEDLQFHERWDETGGFERDVEHDLAIRFEKEEDAVLFKLAWC